MRRLSGRRPWSWRRLGRRLRSRWVYAVAALVVIAGAWTAYDLNAARTELQSARADLATAASGLGGATDSRAAAESLRAATRRAVAQTQRARNRVRRSPVLRAAGWLPVFSAQRNGLVRATNVARQAAAIGDQLAAVAQEQADKLAVRNGAVDLSAVQALADAAGRAGRDLRALPPTHSGSQWGPLGHATRQLDDLRTSTADRLAHGAGVMQVATDLLGAHGPKRIFIALLNNAEMRDQGMVLSYAVAETSDGGFHLTRSGSVLDIPAPDAVSDPKLPPGTQQIFGALQPNQLWESVNATADTSLSGALIRSLYHDATGDTVDGVVALDVPTLGALLRVTGPVSVNGIDAPVSADNVAKLLLDDLYAAGAGESFKAARTDRLEQLAATTDAVIERIRSSAVNGAAVVRALGGAARGGHTWVATADPAGQRALEAAGLAGSPGRVHPERTIHVSVQNGTATKLDYFVDPKVDVAVALGADGTAQVTTTVTLHNDAPVPTPAGEQFGPDGFVTTVPGLYRARVYFWGPSTADQVDSVAESGLRLNFQIADVAAGATKTLTFTTVVPRAAVDGVLRLRFVPQARVRPMPLSVQVTGVGWAVKGAERHLQWDQTEDLSWRVHRH